MANVIASLHLGTPPTPTPPASGKRLFLGADGKLTTIAPDGTIERVGVGLPPADHSHTTFSDTPPLTPKDGDRWVDSATIRAYERLGGAWVEVATTTTT